MVAIKNIKKSRALERREELLERLLQSNKISPLLQGLGIFIKDYETGISIPNTLWKELGHSVQDMRGDRWLSFIHPEDLSKVRRYNEYLLSGVADAWEGEYRICDKEGKYRTIKHRSLVLERGKSGIPTLFMGWDSDITEYVQSTEEAKKQCEILSRRYLRSEEIRNAGIILASELDPSSAAERMLNQARMVVAYDSAAVRAVENGESFLLSSIGFDKFGPPGDVQPRCTESGESIIRTPTLYTPVIGPYRSLMTVPLYKRQNIVGYIDFYALREQAFDSEDLAGAMVFAEQAAIVFSNAMRYKATEQEAATDWLTGLPTRRAFMAKAARLSVEIPRNEPVAMLMMDIDHFKLVNDNYGHLIGDSVLVSIASACREVLRSQDLCCRYGGEEFLILLPGVEERIAVAAAERVRIKIAALRFEGSPKLRLTVSIGISSGTFEGDFRELIGRADEALYMAKEAGRNRCEAR